MRQLVCLQTTLPSRAHILIYLRHAFIGKLIDDLNNLQYWLLANPLLANPLNVLNSECMLACAVFNKQSKGPILLSIITSFLLGKQNVQAKKVY